MAAAIMASTAANATAQPAATPEPVAETVPADALRAMLDARVPGWLADHEVPSVAIAYLRDGEIAFTAVYGEQAPEIPASEQTLYNIASMTKPLVAETVLRLASSGAFSLDEPMAPHWVDPDIAGDARHELLTPRIALAHRTGFPNWRYQTDDVLAFRSDPGERFGYSGEGFNYVGRFAENRMGATLEALVAERIFGPAGMTQTAFIGRPWFENRVAVPQGRDGTRRDPRIRDEWNAADDVHSTVGDYARFLLWAMDDTPLDPEIAAARFTISDDQSAEICGPGRIEEPLCPIAMGVGLGWLVYETPQETVVMHGGADWGERTLGFYVPDRDIGVVIFTNGANGQKVIRDIVRTLYDNESFNAFMA
jgi:CubicO group peptidase (beta-lactamase class C family)